MEERKHWLKIDNAGKIFPAVSNNARSSTFRLSLYLKDEVNKEVLEEVVNELLPRFDNFNVKIKTGLFWNYFAANNNYFKVEEEAPVIGQYYRVKAANQYCFKVLYYKKRITLETFHALSDGTGAMEFLKSIVFEYIKKMGTDMDAQNKIYSEKVINQYETLDAFEYNYDKHNKLDLKEEKAYKIKGEYYPDYWTMFIKTTINTTEFLNLCHKYNVTATQYMCALLMYSIYKNQPNCKKSKKPLKLFVPVNLRKYFKVKTLRNFSLYIKVSVETFNMDYKFEDILQITKKQFEEQLNKELLAKRISANVYFEKNIFIRILPVFLKNIGFKIGYKILGDNISTSYLSNLGVIDLPDEMYNHVTSADFVNSGENLYLTMITLKEKMNMIFSSRLTDKSIIFTILKQLKKDGLDMVIQTNYGDN